MDLNEIQIFLSVVEKNSFIKASEVLNIPPSTVSRKVSELEKRLGVTLLERTTRKIKLTEFGEIYYKECSQGFNIIKTANNLIKQKKLVPEGKLKISASLVVGSEILNKWFIEFINKYPKIELELILDNNYHDFFLEGLDFAFRVDPPDDSNLKAIKIAEINYILCCSKKYLINFREPKKVEDLSFHNCIIVKGKQNKVKWDFYSNDNLKSFEPKGNFITNNLNIAKDFLLANKGIAYLPDIILKKNIEKEEIKVLLPELTAQKREIWGIYSSREPSINIKSFLDFIKLKRNELSF
ncbi:MAG: LysR family transcriptional regulator [Candidatus Sericytochromatia bacterium]